MELVAALIIITLTILIPVITGIIVSRRRHSREIAQLREDLVQSGVIQAHNG